EADPVAHVRRDEQDVGTGGGDPPDHGTSVQMVGVVDEATDEGETKRMDPGDRAVGNGAAVDIVHVRDGEPQRTGGPSERREELSIDERDRIAAEQLPTGGDPEEQPTAARGGRGTDRARLPEQDVSPSGLRGRRLRDRAAVAAEDE